MPVLGIKVKQETSSLYLKIPLSITISIKSFQRDLFVAIAVDRSIFNCKANYALLLLPAYPIQVYVNS